MKVKISDVVVKERLRKVDKNKVRELVESINKLGLLNPITITKDNRLVAGHHRLLACKLLELEHIDANVIDSEGLFIELAEIDENLIRNELHYIDRGRHTARREEILEELGLRKPSHRPEKGADSAYLKTTADIAKEIGISKRTMQEEINMPILDLI